MYVVVFMSQRYVVRPANMADNVKDQMCATVLEGSWHHTVDVSTLARLAKKTVLLPTVRCLFILLKLFLRLS